MPIEDKLTAMGLALPPTREKTIANIAKTVRSGSMLYVSGHGPIGPDGVKYHGHLGSEITVSQGYDAARLSILGCLSSVKAAAGSLDRIAQIVKILVFVSSAPGFNEQPLVANGASDLLLRLFGERGVHGRSAIGVAELPLNMPVEIEMIVELADLDPKSS
jgi:enamine deaminase RidA (YjgF/YER057c/UK114 family)